MKKEPFIAHSELTNEIYIVVGKEKYCVTEQAIKAVVAIKTLEQEPCEESFSQYRQNCIDYVKRTMECVGYRDYIVEQLEKEPCEDVVSLEVYKQVMWERDIAIAQLKELGYGFGEKIRPCEDAVSRQAVLDLPRIKSHNYWGKVTAESVNVEDIQSLPPVTPTRKKGKWNILGCDLYMCSKCYAKFTHKFNYCPNCGAEMESEE